MIKRSHIRQFLALADAGSFTQAAQRIRVTQPTLSAGIAELERLTGTRLFERGRGGVRLTDSGGAFLPVARDLEYRFRLADAFGQDRPDPPRLLRLGTIRTVSDGTLQALAGAIGQAFELELSEGSDYELRALMASGRLDAALTILRDDETGTDVYPLFDEPYTMFAAANHRMAGSKDVHPADLASEIMIARRACEALAATSRFFTRNGVRPRFAFKSDNDSRCIHLVAAGVGITAAPRSLMIDGIRTIDVRGYDLTRRVGILFNDRIPAAPLLKTLFDNYAPYGIPDSWHAQSIKGKP